MASLKKLVLQGLDKRGRCIVKRYFRELLKPLVLKKAVETPL